MADITDEFSFAYMKEAFVATLLSLARKHDDSDEEEEADGDDNGDDPLDKYEIWRVFKAQVKILRSEMGNEESVGAESTTRVALGAYEGISASQYEEMMSLLDAMRMQGEPQPGKALSSLAAPVFIGESHDMVVQDLSPIRSYAPLAKKKLARLNEGVWDWGL